MRRPLLLLVALLAVGCDRAVNIKGVWCERDEDCGGTTPHCDVEWNTCIGPDFGVDGSGGDLGDLADAATPPDLMPECASSTTCPTEKPICDTGAGKCRACVVDTDDAACASRDGAQPFCGSSGACVACKLASQCPASAPICSSSGSCAACSSAADDATCSTRTAGAQPRCKVSGTNAGQCVACAAAANTESNDCAGAAPICSDAGACRACAAHGECDAGVCIFDGADAGKCAAAAQVALVDNGGLSVSACETARPTRDGNASATAYCDVAEAVSETAKRPYALVAGSAEPYSAITIANRTLTIVGPGVKASPTARLFTLSQPAVGVMVSASQVAILVLDGLDLGGDASSKTSNGLFCSRSGGTASATVTVRNSSLHDSSSAGVDSSGCGLQLGACSIASNGGGGVSTSGGTLQLDACNIASNGGAGLQLGGATNYTVTNTIIAGNGSGAPGVDLSSAAASGTFAFNTVAGNGGLVDNEGGIVCASTGGDKIIAASIVAGNSHNPMSGGTQFAGTKCVFQTVVVGTDSTSAAGVVKDKPPSFTADYHLKISDAPSVAANQDCCINKLPAPTSPNADHDVDRTARPKGTGATPFDIGAHEVQ